MRSLRRVRSAPLLCVGLAAALIGSTVLTLIVTVYVFLLVKRLTGKARPTGDEA